MLTNRRTAWLRTAVLLILICFLAVGPGVSIASASSATWSNGTAPDNFKSLTCVSDTFCASVTGLSDAMIFDGTTWTEYSVQGAFGWGWDGVSCVPSSPVQCVALSQFGVTYTYDVTTWEKATSGLPSAWNYAFSCGAANSCEALIWGLSYGDFYSWNGTSWTEVGSTPTIPSSGAIDCTSATFCVAVAGHFVYTFNGTSWSSGTSLKLATTASEDNPTLNSVSCPSTTYCMVSDGYAETFSFNGTTWSNAGTPLSYGGEGEVSCASPTFCLATNAGKVAEYNGAEWSAPVVIQPANEVSTDDTDYVSCPSVTFCMITLSASDYAIYSGGQVARYPATTTLKVSPKSASGIFTISLHLAGVPAPTGTVAVKLSSAVVCHGAVAGGAFTCKVSVARLKVGRNRLIVSYSGDVVWEPYTGSAIVTR